jgi:hypothetical protein
MQKKTCALITVILSSFLCNNPASAQTNGDQPFVTPSQEPALPQTYINNSNKILSTYMPSAIESTGTSAETITNTSDDTPVNSNINVTDESVKQEKLQGSQQNSNMQDIQSKTGNQNIETSESAEINKTDEVSSKTEININSEKNYSKSATYDKNQSDTKTEQDPESKKQETKPDSKTEPASDSQTVEKSEQKPESKEQETNSDSKTESASDSQTVEKSEQKPESKEQETKPDSKTEHASDSQTVEKPEQKTESKEQETKPDLKTEPASDSQTVEKPEQKTESKEQETKADSKTETTSDNQTVEKPEQNTDSSKKDSSTDEIWGDDRDKINLNKNNDDEHESDEVSQEDMDIVNAIMENYTKIKNGSPNNEELFYANMLNGRQEISAEGYRCPDRQYHVDLVTAVTALKLTAIGQKKDDLLTAKYYKNKSGKTWTVVFYKNEKPEYVILHFRPVSNNRYIKQYKFSQEFSNYTHSFAGHVGTNTMTEETLAGHLEKLPPVEDLDRYSIQLKHWLIITEDMYILKPQENSFNRKKRRFVEPINPLSVSSSARNTIESLIKNFDFNTNATVVLIDRAKNNSYLINDDRDGLFHYLDEDGNETKQHLNLCYEDM